MKVRAKWISGIAVALMLTGLVFPVALFAATLFGSARLHEINQSGIEAAVVFADSGTSLKVLGAASGLDPTHVYISLIYGLGSSPSGPLACEPTPNPNRTLTGPEMVVGFWQVDTDGNGTLVVPSKTGAGYAPVTNAGTISIRDVTEQGQLKACGVVSVNP